VVTVPASRLVSFPPLLHLRAASRPPREVARPCACARFRPAEAVSGSGPYPTSRCRACRCGAVRTVARAIAMVGPVPRTRPLVASGRSAPVSIPAHSAVPVPRALRRAVSAFLEVALTNTHTNPPPTSPTSPTSPAAADAQSALERAFGAVLEDCPHDFRASLDRSFTQALETAFYRAEIVRMHEEFSPLSPIEWCTIRDVAAMAVEIARNERMVADLVDFGRTSALLGILKDSKGNSDVTDDDLLAIAEDYAKGDPEAVEYIDTELRQMGHTPTILGALSRARCAGTVEPIERSIHGTRKAQSNLLRDLMKARRASGRKAGKVADRRSPDAGSGGPGDAGA
jgi:hypothetical protein